MIEVGWAPRVRCVAVIAHFAARDVVGVLSLGHGAVVAARAEPQHLQVIDANHRRPVRRTVAILTNICRVDVRGVLAFGGCAVVAADTVCDDAEMVESGRQPRVCAMAGLALVTARRMIDRLTGSGDAVVAAATTPDHLAVIDAPDRAPRRLQMTVLAQLGGQDVHRGHWRSLYEPGTRMTAAAFTRRSLENPADVTSLTIRISVCTLQRIARREMIEVGAECRLSERRTAIRNEDSGQKDERDNHPWVFHLSVLSTDWKSLVV
jgi:hypothetical protein